MSDFTNDSNGIARYTGTPALSGDAGEAIDANAGVISAAITTLTAAIAAANATLSACLRASNDLSDLASASAARTNLGLGSAATTSAGAYDVAGAASAVNAALITHEGLNGTAVHGLGTASTHAATDFATPASVAAAIASALANYLPLPTGASVTGANLTLNGNLWFTAGNRTIGIVQSDTAGDLSIVGRAALSAGGTGGNVNIQGGTASGYHGTSGGVSISGGTSSSYQGTAGGVTIAGGAGADTACTSGAVSIAGGSCFNNGGKGGGVSIAGGSSANSTAGNLVLAAGASGGTPGQIEMSLPTTDPSVHNALYALSRAITLSAA